MRTSQRLQAYAAPTDHVSHLGPRPDSAEVLTLCGLYLEPMALVSATTEKRPCVVCDELAR